MSFALFASPALEFLPRVADQARAALGFQHWQEALARNEDPELAKALGVLSAVPEVNSLLKGLFANSPFLGDCLLSDTQNLALLVNEGPTSLLDKAFARLKDPAIQADLQACKVTLRHARRQAALAIGLADILRLWDVDRCTEALSELADLSLRLALTTLLRQAAARGEITLKNDADPLAGCGYVVLGLGKLGARELNFSSDIDLIVIYDPPAIDYRGSKGLPEFTVRLTQGLVQLLSERTGDGYAFRVDLRLRPDPGATPLAISYAAALTYYESMGQNWERAAMIKARPSAGDLALGAQFLKELNPFMWRRSLDFLAIQDIHSIKRQIHALKGGATIAVEGHNIKLGRGGIREIEFFAQTQQLIWGGRNPTLRSPSTKAAIRALAVAGHVKAETAEGLCQSYDFLRRVEHRLQMVADQQTHSLPSAPAEMESLAAFLSYPDVESFRAELLIHLHRVEDHYAELFEESPSLAGPGNLVFTGGEPEPGTVETLTKLGFLSPETVFNLVRAWHHGRYRAMRSQRARELLTEIMPSLLGAFGKSANPDAALAKFDEFLSGLPAGVQLFALLVANPSLLDLLAEVMGSAPALADHLSRRPQLIDALLAPGFLDSLPDYAALSRELAERLAAARDFQDVLDYVRRWAADRRFQAGLHLLRGLAPEARIGQALSDIAEVSLQGLLPAVESEFARQHGRMPGSAFAVLAFGRLGSREMTVTSDLDLLFLYEKAEGQSDGAKPLDAMTYYARLSQRFINAITAPTGEGLLYPVDMRLRPSGNAGPIATTLAGFERYQKNEAWTWEHMALTRARFIAGDRAFGEKVSASVKAILTAERDPQKLLADVADMRLRLEKEKPARGPWDLRRRKGGLLDAEFLAQYLQLRHAHLAPELLGLSTDRIFEKAGENGLLAPEEAEALASTMRFERLIQAYLRLTLGDTFGVEEAGEQLRIGLARACGALDFTQLSNKLEELTLVLRQSLEEHLLNPAKHLKEGKKE